MELAWQCEVWVPDSFPKALNQFGSFVGQSTISFIAFSSRVPSRPTPAPGINQMPNSLARQ